MLSLRTNKGRQTELQLCKQSWCTCAQQQMLCKVLWREACCLCNLKLCSPLSQCIVYKTPCLTVSTYRDCVHTKFRLAADLNGARVVCISWDILLACLLALACHLSL